MKKSFSIIGLILFLLQVFSGLIYFNNVNAQSEEVDYEVITQGEMITVLLKEDGANEKEEIVSLPLKHTSVEGEVSGFVGRTTVVQEFQNPFDEPIEAIYNFPLPNEAAVDSMEMKIGDRTIVGRIEKKEEAEKQYEEAKHRGQTASLLNQQRPNIFTQKVANIMPGDDIKITISYFQTLKYEEGKYNYVFPMVVGPRYNPASVADAGEITSSTIPEGYRNGHDISLKLRINAGVDINKIQSNSHDIDVKKISDSEAEISLKSDNEIPNKDFSVTYNVASDEPQLGFLTHKEQDKDYGFFTLIVEPQKSPKITEIRAKEIVFVLDTSGSMRGRPIESVKQAMKKAISNLNSFDYFNVYNFSNTTNTLFSEAVKASEENKDKGLSFVKTLSAGGGTVMDTPFKEALKNDGNYQDRMRIILIMTDGDIGNENEILRLIKSNLGKNRVFVLGIDSSPNRFLLDRISEVGNGKTTYILGNDNIDEKVDEFYNNFANPVLTDIAIDWDGLEVFDILPFKYADLYAGQPLYVYGKYTGELDKTRNIKITAKKGNDDYTQIIPLEFKSEEEANSSIASLWARTKVKEIYKENYFTKNSKLEEDVTALGLEYSIMTQYTSFIAIDDLVRNQSDESETIKVPTYEVEGKEYEMMRDDAVDVYSMNNSYSSSSRPNVKSTSSSFSKNSGGGGGGGGASFADTSGMGAYNKSLAVPGVSDSIANSDSLLDVVQRAVNRIILIIGGIFVIVLCNGGLMMITSYGKKDKSPKGLSIAKKAAIGIIILAVIWVLIRIVLFVIATVMA